MNREPKKPKNSLFPDNDKDNDPKTVDISNLEMSAEERITLTGATINLQSLELLLSVLSLLLAYKVLRSLNKRLNLNDKRPR